MEKSKGKVALLKENLSTAPMLVLPNINILFKVKYDAFGKGVKFVPSQEGWLIEYMREKLNKAWQKWPYDQEFYAILKILKSWGHCLIQKEFVFYSYHQVLKYFNIQQDLSKLHKRSVTYIQKFTFILKHKFGQ